jgi:hypothetical protein
MPSRISLRWPCLAGLTGLLVTAAVSDACPWRRSNYAFAPVAAPRVFFPPMRAPEKAPEADPLKVGEAYVVMVKLKAEGVQIYECKPKKDNPKDYEWVLKAPEAKLFDDKGKEVGKHFADPTWEAVDGSKIVAQVPPEASVVKPDAIPWLKLKVKSSEGKGLLAEAKYIQRVDTVGGLAPKSCDASYAATELRVPYKAIYVFYEEKK